MTVKIGEMTATFSNADTLYVAVGMHVTDNGSAVGSKLLNLTTNNNTKFEIYKSGSTRITAQEDEDSGTNLFEVINYTPNVSPNVVYTTDLFYVQPNIAVFGTDAWATKTAYVQSYSEGFAESYTSNSHLILNLNEASVFTAMSGNNYISKITFIKPDMNVISDVAKSFSCSVIFKDIDEISVNAWVSSNVMWADGCYPQEAGNTFILTFLNVTNADIWGQDDVWLGIISGIRYQTVG